MSCLLCDSIYHLSHNCDVFESDESRQEALVSKNWCPKCLCRISHAKNWTRCRAKNNKKCYLCFSREHHTIFCPDRYTVPNMIVPAIDEDLHKRFFQLFKDFLLEQYFLAFLSPKMFDTINTWPNGRPSLGSKLRVTNTPIQLYDSLKNEIDANKIEEQRISVLFVTNEVNLNGIDSKSYIYKCTLRPGIDYRIVFKVKQVILKRCDIPDKAFLKLLSQYTKILECYDVELTPAVKFVDIIRRAQNVQEFILDDTNILTDHLWADNLLRYKNSNNFLKLEIEIYSYKCNVESLAMFVKTKCLKNVHLVIYIMTEDKENYGHKKELLDKLSNYFEYTKNKCPIISFYSVQIDSYDGKFDHPLASFTNLLDK